ncbi:EAP30/Vps36 family-domain-containing protein [Mrakia frigida]|uniref:ESCRT-II subunit protein VPS36 n=1 Tax=Mrakia frigida TaxID=29902 RepID=UPI003FCC22D6
MDHFSPLPPAPSPQAVLFHSEELASQPFPGVGLYETNTKLPAPLDILTVHLSTHRILLSVPPPPNPSLPSSSSSSTHVRTTFPHGLSIPLSHIRQTEFYAGFLTSSAKVTLHLTSSSITTTASSSSSPIASSSSPSILSPTPSMRTSSGWPCPLCGFANPQPPPGATDKMVKCQMCGVSKEASLAAVPSSRPSSTHFSTTSTPPPPSPNGDLISTGEGGEISCPTCTFLNHPSLRECEICSSPLPSRSTSTRSAPTSTPQPAAAAASTPARGGGGPEKLSTVRLSFRRGGEKEFYKLLKRALADRAWAGGEPRLSLNTSTTNGGSPSASGTSTPVEGRPGVGGIDRILNTLSVEDATRSTSIDTSLRDLESLMAKASEMVKLASSLSLRLQQSSSNNSTPGDASAAQQEIHSTLLQLGLAAPAVTQDMVTSKEEGAYLRELARELGGLLTGEGGLMVDSRRGGGNGKGGRSKGRGMIGLDEVWCAWNRARGVALIPPKTLPLLLPLLSQFTSPPISPLTLQRTRQTLLHTPHHSPASFRARLVRTLTAPALAQPSSSSPTSTSPSDPSSGGPILATESLSLIELALAEEIGVGVAGELVWELEMNEGREGEVVRDSQGGAGAGGDRWWWNWMKGVEWREVNDF